MDFGIVRFDDSEAIDMHIENKFRSIPHIFSRFKKLPPTLMDMSRKSIFLLIPSLNKDGLWSSSKNIALVLVLQLQNKPFYVSN